jgi:replicative DNA helicase
MMYHSGEGSNTTPIIKKILDPTDTSGVIKTGFQNFDSRASGWRRKDFIVLASHFKGGKSTMAMNILRNQYLFSNLRVCHVVLEGGPEMAHERELSLVSGVHHSKIRDKSYTYEEIQRANNAWKQFNQHGIDNKCKFTTWCRTGWGIEELEINLKPHGFDVVCIDYLSLLPAVLGKGQNDPSEISASCKRLKHMSANLNCVTIGLMQLDEETGKLRYSRAPYEDADNVWTWKYGETERSSHRLEIKQPASRSFAPFTFPLQEDFSCMFITDAAGSFDDSDENDRIKRPVAAA